MALAFFRAWLLRSHNECSNAWATGNAGPQLVRHHASGVYGDININDVRVEAQCVTDSGNHIVDCQIDVVGSLSTFLLRDGLPR